MTIRQVDGKKQRILRQLPCELCDINILTICRIQHFDGLCLTSLQPGVAFRFFGVTTPVSGKHAPPHEQSLP